MHELWLYRNPEALKMVVKGLEEARAGQTGGLGLVREIRSRRYRVGAGAGPARFHLVFTPAAREALALLAKDAWRSQATSRRSEDAGPLRNEPSPSEPEYA